MPITQSASSSINKVNLLFNRAFFHNFAAAKNHIFLGHIRIYTKNSVLEKE